MIIVGTFLQIVIAVVVAVALFFVAFSVYNAEIMKALSEAGNVRKRTDIFKGIKDLTASNNESYNTLDPTHPSYKDLKGSVNQKGGAEYTYNFWMHVQYDSRNPTQSTGNFKTDGGINTGPKPYILFLRGNKKPFVYKNLCTKSSSVNPTLKTDVLVKNPMVKLENGGDVLSVEINTMAKPDSVQQNARDTCNESSGDWEYMNKYRIALKNLKGREELNQKWFMVTIIVQDTYPNDPLPLRNKVRVRIYQNGTLELDKYLDGSLGDSSGASSVMKVNSGNFYVAPTIRDVTETNPGFNVKLADMSYFNYVLDPSDIKALFSGGFSKTVAPAVGATNTITDEVNNPVSFASSTPILSPL